jgi:membrane protein YdbS with pleckstrin-like domain
MEFALRRHPLTLLLPLVALLCMSLVPFVFYLFIMPRALPGFLYYPYQDIFFLLATLYYGFLWMIAALAWSDYYLDVFLVTNKRIMKVEQAGLFNRVVAELELENIQDITSSVIGPLRTLLDFGDLSIQTASEVNKIQPKDIPHPVRVRRRIMELCTAKKNHPHP